MNITEAIEATTKGLRVRRTSAEASQTSVRAFEREGDSIIAIHLSGLTERIHNLEATDWTIVMKYVPTDGNFELALNKLRDGVRMRRACWLAGVYMELDNHPNRGVQIVMNGYPQTLSGSDIFANDWQVYQEKPKEVTMSFGEALELAIKKDRNIKRASWKGNGVFVYLRHDNGSEEACLIKRTAEGKLQPGWLASQADMLANDWVTVS